MLAICIGNVDFGDLLEKRVQFKELFLDSDGKPIAWVEATVGRSVLRKENFDVVRSVKCQLLVEADKLCEPCKQLRKCLFLYKARATDPTGSSSQISDQSHTNFRYLTVQELQVRIKNLSKSKKTAISKAAHYSLKIDKMLSGQGVTLDSEPHILVKEVLERNDPNLEEGAAQWLLWQQQIEQATKCDKRTMRWHPLIVRWCLSIYHASPAAYRQIASKKNKFLVLPHVKTR